MPRDLNPSQQNRRLRSQSHWQTFSRITRYLKLSNANTVCRIIAFLETPGQLQIILLQEVVSDCSNKSQRHLFFYTCHPLALANPARNFILSFEILFHSKDNLKGKLQPISRIALLYLKHQHFPLRCVRSLIPPNY